MIKNRMIIVFAMGLICSTGNAFDTAFCPDPFGYPANYNYGQSGALLVKGVIVNKENSTSLIPTRLEGQTTAGRSIQGRVVGANGVSKTLSVLNGSVSVLVNLFGPVNVSNFPPGKCYEMSPPAPGWAPEGAADKNFSLCGIGRKATGQKLALLKGKNNKYLMSDSKSIARISVSGMPSEVAALPVVPVVTTSASNTAGCVAVQSSGDPSAPSGGEPTVEPVGEIEPPGGRCTVGNCNY